MNKDGVDRKALRRYRLSRIRQQLQQRDYAAVIFFDPINIRYATDTSNMQVWVLHNPVRYVFVPPTVAAINGSRSITSIRRELTP
ncbi:MAG: aminopeptidase P family N-terminal domain-containing protein [Gammaproteobacteria bacterium]|nr:aminopeptidase P family N-terminal domain-containing protein [Gammaproteobacteria bacterium]